MYRANWVVNQLQKKSFGQAEEVLAVEGDLQVRVKLADWDRLGCLLEKLEVQGVNHHTLILNPTHMEKEINYLGEPLRVFEVDQTGGTVILRSFPPRKNGETLSFFEMVLDRSWGLSLVRLAYDHRLGKRTTLPAPLSRDTLERLLTDLVRLVSEN